MSEIDYLLRTTTYAETIYKHAYHNNIFQDIFAGATQTTGVALEWAMSELVRHPEAMAKARIEIREVLGQGRAVITNSDLAGLHYMWMIIKEVLRLHPPGPLIPRRAREDRKVMGFDML